MSLAPLVDGGEHALVDPEGHGRGEEGEGEVADDGEEGDILHGEEEHEHGPEDDGGVSGAVPVDEGVPAGSTGPHPDDVSFSCNNLKLSKLSSLQVTTLNQILQRDRRMRTCERRRRSRSLSDRTKNRCISNDHHSDTITPGETLGR